MVTLYQISVHAIQNNLIIDLITFKEGNTISFEISENTLKLYAI